MDYTTAHRTLAAIEASRSATLVHQLLEGAARYARLRAQWWLSDATTRRELDAERTAAHNAFIDACNILSRKMAQDGEDNGWRETLTSDRREIGDFACLLTAILGLRAR